MLKKVLRKSLMPFLAFVLALIIGGIVIGLTDSRVNSKITQPVEFFKALFSTVGNAYLSLFQGAIYDPNLAEGKGFIHGFYPFSETLLAAAPLILCGLAVAVAFKSGLFNIGAQGQFIFGAIGASYIGFKYDLPVGIHILAAVAFAIVLAGLWGGIAGVLKAKTGAHEVIVTIMLNYIAARFILWLLGQQSFRRQGRIDPLAPPVKESSRLPLLFGDEYRVNVGFVIALAVAALMYFILNRTTLGFRFTTDIAGSFGFDAITVALLGQGSPVGVVLASILFAALRVGGVTMQSNVQVPVEIVLVIQALVVLFIAAPGLVAKIFKVRTYEKATSLVSKGWNG
jgi:simple sugar transport system permease protein